MPLFSLSFWLGGWKKVKMKWFHPLATMGSVYSGLPCHRIINRFFGFLWSARESPQQVLCGGSEISKGGGWDFLLNGEQKVWPALGADRAFSAATNRNSRPTEADGNVSSWDGTLGNVCPQAKDLGVPGEEILQAEQLPPSMDLLA